jgi:hypothetical protein
VSPASGNASIKSTVNATASFASLNCFAGSNRKLEMGYCGATTAGAYGAAAGESFINAQTALTLAIGDASKLKITATSIESALATIKLTGLATHADNAAAAGAGLTAGTLYKTAGGELRIVV